MMKFALKTFLSPALVLMLASLASAGTMAVSGTGVGTPDTLGLPLRASTALEHFNGLDNLLATDGFDAPTTSGTPPTTTWTDPTPNDSLVTVIRAKGVTAHWIPIDLTNRLPTNHSFTAEARVKMVTATTDNNLNNFVMWLDDSSTANNAKGAIFRVYTDKVVWGYKTLTTLKTVDNTDALHDYRVDGLSNGKFAVWRDGVLLGTDLVGDVTARTKRAIFGSYTNTESISAIVDHVAFDETGSYAVPEPSSMVLCLSGLAFVGGLAYRRRKQS